MINAILQVEFCAGQSPEECIEAGRQIADKLDCPVRGGFNGTPLTVYPGQDVEEALENFESLRRLLK